MIIDQLSLSVPDDRVSRALARALDDPSLAVRAAAVTALSQVGTAEAIAPLQALVDSEQPEVLREHAREAIVVIQQATAPPAQ